jgi:pyruvate/oxaloacetate carboxyltransferase
VREDLGFPPLVTPTSQIVGVQAVVNVLLGERYKQITHEVSDYVRGLYGQPPGPIDPELAQRVLQGDKPIEGRPADLLEPEFLKALSEVRAFVPAADEAEALSYAMFPQVFRSYAQARERGLTTEVVTAAAVGIVGALRTPPPPAPTPVAPAPAGGAAGGGGVSPWAHEGRVTLGGSGRWVDANRGRDRR